MKYVGNPTLSDTTQKLKYLTYFEMTKVEIVNEIGHKTMTDKQIIASMVEALIETMKHSVNNGNNVYFRGLGTFHLKGRAEKIGWNISKYIAIKIPVIESSHSGHLKSLLKKLKQRLIDIGY